MFETDEEMLERMLASTALMEATLERATVMAESSDRRDRVDEPPGQTV
jgi:hypothetical protein